MHHRISTVFFKPDFLFLHVLFFLLGGRLSISAQTIAGDELPKLLGKRENTVEVKQLTEQAGSDYVSTGIKLTVSDQKLTKIEIFNEKNSYNPNQVKYLGTLPHNINLTMTIFKLKQAIGEPYETAGELDDSYIILKEYKLDEVNGYTLNAEFVKGHFNTLSFSYNEGGAVEADNEKSEGLGGIRSDDYPLIMKKNLNNLTVARFREMVGDPFYTDRSQWLFIRQGASIHLNDRGQIIKMIFYSGGQPSEKGKPYGSFNHVMPLGIKFTDSRDIVSQKAGVPTQDLGEAWMYKMDLCETKVYFSGNTVSKIVMEFSEEADKALEEKRLEDEKNRELYEQTKKKTEPVPPNSAKPNPTSSPQNKAVKDF